MPYLADLVGLHEVPPDLGVAVSRRALVANTVAYRRRKGTVAVLEQVARDVTGWPTRAVEYHPLLATSAHVNHVRLDRAAAPSLRDAARLEPARSPARRPPRARSTRSPHTAEVRRIATRPRPLRDQQRRHLPVPGADVRRRRALAPRRRGGWSRRARCGWHHFDPLGRATPLFAAAARRGRRSSAWPTEPDLPRPAAPAAAARAAAARAAASSTRRSSRSASRIDGPTRPTWPPERIRVCRLETLRASDEPQVMVDAVAGRLQAYRRRTRPRATCPRRSSSATPTARWPTSAPAPTTAPTSTSTCSPTDLWTAERPDDDLQVARRDGQRRGLDRGGPRRRLGGARRGRRARHGEVSIGDSGHYPGDLAVAVPAATRLVLVAARWPTRAARRRGWRPSRPARTSPTGCGRTCRAR